MGPTPEPPVVLHLHRCRRETGLGPAQVSVLCAVRAYELAYQGLPVPRGDLRKFGENYSRVDALFPLTELKEMGLVERVDTAFGAGFATTGRGRLKIREMREEPARRAGSAAE